MRYNDGTDGFAVRRLDAVRKVVVPVALGAWIYSWFLLRGVRAEYVPGSLGPIPGWLIALLGLALVVTLGACVSAAMRLPVWPWLALAGAVLLAASVLGSHYGVMSSVLKAFARSGARVSDRVTLADAARAALRTRGPLHLALVGAMLALLALAGATGAVLGRGGRLWAERPRGSDRGEEALP
ncbi:MAG: hypothetical protein ACRDJG_07525 [Actinomycetota bacterium]